MKKTLFCAFLAMVSCGGSTGRSTMPETERKLLEGDSEMTIVTWDPQRNTGDPTLRKKASSVSGMTRSDLLQLDRRMRLTLEKSGGVGLAAPQVGVSVRMILVQLQNEAKTVITCLDPEIEIRSGNLVDGYEGCLSIPGLGGKVKRHEQVQVRCLALDGRTLIHESTGFEARIFQHEVDHLEGELYIDKLEGDLMPIEEMRRRREAEKTGEQTPPEADTKQ